MAITFEKIKETLFKFNTNLHEKPSGWKEENAMLAGYLEAAMHSKRLIDPAAPLPIREVKEKVMHNMYPIIPVKYTRTRMETKQECIVRLVSNFMLTHEYKTCALLEGRPKYIHRQS